MCTIYSGRRDALREAVLRIKDGEKIYALIQFDATSQRICQRNMKMKGERNEIESYYYIIAGRRKDVL